MTESRFIRRHANRNPFSFMVLRSLLVPFVYLFHRPVFINREVIPDDGKAILAGNHRFFADPLIVCCSTKRPVRFLCKSLFYYNPVIGWFFVLAQTIPVKKTNRNHRSLGAAEAVLNNGELIGIFPEGTRKKNPKSVFLRFRTGAVRMAANTGAPIIPLAMRGGIIPFIRPVTVIFGDPYYIDEDCDPEYESEKLREKVIALYNSAA